MHVEFIESIVYTELLAWKTNLAVSLLRYEKMKI